MAATRLIPLHVNRGRSVAQTLSARTDYSENAAKTDNGKYISSYECDPKTVDEEFMLSKRQYEHSTGRHQKNDIIAYQIRQSFKPGEITPEEANQIGYELAMRFTRGKYAFIVATHVDRAHIHNHIVFNSTSIDGSRKFRNFFFSYKAVQKISDRLCVEHGLSIIDAKPYRERQKGAEHPAENSHRDQLRADIDAALGRKPKDFEEFLKFLEEAGYEVKRGQNTAFRGKGQERFIRLRSLGEGYAEEDLRAVIAGEKKHQPKKPKAEKKSAAQTPKLGLLIDIEAKMAEGKGAGYERWAKTYNLKQMAEAVCFIKEQGVNTYDELVRRTESAVAGFNELGDSIKASEKRMAEIAALKQQIKNYSDTRETYKEYRKSGYSRQFLETHREEITLHKAAKAAFDQLKTPDGGKAKIPSIRQLDQEYAEILSGKKRTYTEYRAARKEMKDLLTARKTVETILEISRKDEQKKEQEKGQEQENR